MDLDNKNIKDILKTYKIVLSQLDALDLIERSNYNKIILDQALEDSDYTIITAAKIILSAINSELVYRSTVN